VPNPISPSSVAEHLWADDRASQTAGFYIESVGFRSATLSMMVRADQVNGHGICHGGIIFQLADSAFAFACNSENEVAVAAGATIEFVAPAQLGDSLVATATEHWVEGRSGLTDVVVTRPADQTVVAHFRGRSRRLGRMVIL
jgi:phenylacetic acid degradation protein PaaD